MSKLNLFIPITKIDEENRLVYGRIAAEELDNSGEMFDYESSKPNFEKWSNDQYEASGGLSKGNVRVMHGPIAAGKLTDIHYDDTNRVIEGVAKIVDDNEWQKCLAGVYTGFSMGGRYERRWSEGGVRKYTALPAEVSIVDKPCIKSARFAELIKCDGTIEQMELGKGWDESKHPRNPSGGPQGGQFSGKVRASGNTWDARIAEASAETRTLYNRVYESAAAAGWDNVDSAGNSKIEEAIGWAATQLEPSDDFETWDTTVQAYLDNGGPPDVEKFTKGVSMDYEPTNDEMLARATDLAKAAGGTDWLAFKDQAITELKAEHAEKLGKADAPEHTDEDCKVDKCTKCADMAAAKADGAEDLTKADGGDEVVEGEAPGGDADLTKADEYTGPVQKWEAKDGSVHLRKSDAIAHDERLAAGPSISDQIADLRKSIATDADPVEIATAAVDKLDDEQFTKFIAIERLQKFVDARLADMAALNKADGLTDEDKDKLEKFAAQSEENELLKTQITGLRSEIESVGPALEELRKEITLIKSTPIPGGPAATDVRVVDKGQDQLLGKGAAAEPVNPQVLLGELQKSIASGALKSEDVADMAIRAAQSAPHRVSLG